MVRPVALDALKMAQDVGWRQDFLGSSRSRRCCSRQLARRGSPRWPRSSRRRWVGAPRRRGARGEAGIVVYAECHTAVGVPGRWEMTAVIAPFLSQPPPGLALSRFVDSVRRSPLRVQSGLAPLHDKSSSNGGSGKACCSIRGQGLNCYPCGSGRIRMRLSVTTAKFPGQSSRLSSTASARALSTSGLGPDNRKKPRRFVPEDRIEKPTHQNLYRG